MTTASIATGKTASFLSPASDYCQRHTNRQQSWRHISEGGFNSRLFEVASITQPVAIAFTARHHYAGKAGGYLANFGLYLGEQLVGIASLTNAGFERVLLKAFPKLVPYRESAELGRFVLTDEVPANAESWFLAEAFRQAAALGFRGIVSHSDPVARFDAQGNQTMPGHIGTIYQASNATYTGRADGRTIWHLPTGRVFNEQEIGKIRQQKQGHEYSEEVLRSFGASPRRRRESGLDYWRRARTEAGCTSTRHPGNHRYQFALGDRRQRRSVSLGFGQLPYPKKDS
jgi:hypothetical protein